MSPGRVGRPAPFSASSGTIRQENFFPRFVAQGIGYDAAMVSLDLAVLYLRQGRTDEVRRLAEEMLPIFQAQDVHREAFAALVLFQEAARHDQMTLDRAIEILTYLREARTDPERRFGWKKRGMG